MVVVWAEKDWAWWVWDDFQVKWKGTDERLDTCNEGEDNVKKDSQFLPWIGYLLK